MKRIHLALLAGALGLASASSAFADGDIGWSVTIGSPAPYYHHHYAPRVVYAAPPVVYYEPEPVYYRYYSPAPRVYYYEPRPHGYRHWDHDRDDHHGHGRGHRH